jgi:hypothetical protein
MTDLTRSGSSRAGSSVRWMVRPSSSACIRSLSITRHDALDGDVDAGAAAESLEQRGGVRHGHVCCSVSTAHDVTS